VIALALSLLVLTQAPGMQATRGMDVPGLFGAGVEAYRRGEHAAAAQAWERLLGEDLGDPARGALLHDLGNAAYRRGEALAAVGWYSAALRHAPREEDTWANLELARREAGLPPADAGDLNSAVARSLGSVTELESRWLAFAGLSLLAAALLGEALRGGMGWRRACLGGAVLALVASAPLGWRLARPMEDPLFIVEPGGVPLRSEPDLGMGPIQRLEAGEWAERIDELPGWVRLEAGGERGWAPRESVLDANRSARRSIGPIE